MIWGLGSRGALLFVRPSRAKSRDPSSEVEKRLAGRPGDLRSPRLLGGAMPSIGERRIDCGRLAVWCLFPAAAWWCSWLLDYARRVPRLRLGWAGLVRLERQSSRVPTPFGSSLSRTPRRVLDRLEPNGVGVRNILDRRAQSGWRRGATNGAVGRAVYEGSVCAIFGVAPLIRPARRVKRLRLGPGLRRGTVGVVPSGETNKKGPASLRGPSLTDRGRGWISASRTGSCGGPSPCRTSCVPRRADRASGSRQP